MRRSLIAITAAAILGAACSASLGSSKVIVNPELVNPVVVSGAFAGGAISPASGGVGTVPSVVMLGVIAPEMNDDATTTGLTNSGLMLMRELPNAGAAAPMSAVVAARAMRGRRMGILRTVTGKRYT